MTKCKVDKLTADLANVRAQIDALGDRLYQWALENYRRPDAGALGCYVAFVRFYDEVTCG